MCKHMRDVAPSGSRIASRMAAWHTHDRLTSL